MKKAACLSFLPAFLLMHHAYSQIDYKGFPQWTWHRQDSTEYYLYTPSSINKDSLYPVALFLHGCCGKDYHATLRNTVDPPVRMWHNFGANTQKVPTYIIAPATSSGWKQHMQNLKTVIDSIVRFANGDPKRIYITGFSMGGNGTWEFIRSYPGYFTAAIPMGMNFRGEHEKIKDIPIWTFKGETDHWADSLQHDVWQIRKLNGVDTDSTDNLVTGVNPRFTSFKGVGHNVQWIAASTFDLTAWAYEKINDGNRYPVVHFESPSRNLVVKKGSRIDVKLFAKDADGSINRIVVRVNGEEKATLRQQPYQISLKIPEGDVVIEATAFDESGKSSTATTIVKTDIPVRFRPITFPSATQGALFMAKITASGNGAVAYKAKDITRLPPGIILRENGECTGVPVAPGNYSFHVIATDEDGDEAQHTFRIPVAQKTPGEVVVTNAVHHSGKSLPVSRLMAGSHVHADNEDDEVTVSDPSAYTGYTLIPTINTDTTEGQREYVTFYVDEPATVYVAYETKDNLFTSSLPPWLKEWKKSESPQIVTQYFYYDVYSREYPKGKVSLPSPFRKENRVDNNYFILVKNSGQ